MRKPAFIVLALLFLPAAAFAWSFEMAGVDWRPYITMDVQLGFGSVIVQKPTNVDWDLNRATAVGGLYNLGLGLKHNRFRIEGDYLFRATMNDTISWLVTGVVTATGEEAGILNIYYDYLSKKFFSMYIGGGAGFSSWSQAIAYTWLGSEQYFNRSGTDLMLGLYTGMAFTIKDTLSIDLGLTYYHTNTIDLSSFGVKFGLRYTL
jgi:opacity protein-like surface antigen